uniref:Arrestin C-terminal-like domain-containing protein n=1 Tax=Glossina austeni TaxID=7395 RepID=A0A1A9VG81_GLOAU
MGYDDVLIRLGDFGKYQKIIYFLICLTLIICAFHKLAGVFLLAKPDYRCLLPFEDPNSNVTEYELKGNKKHVAYPKGTLSDNKLGSNVLLNFVISGAVEIPAYTFLLLTLKRWERRTILCGCMLTAGVALLLTILVPKDMNWLIIALAMIGPMIMEVKVPYASYTPGRKVHFNIILSNQSDVHCSDVKVRLMKKEVYISRSPETKTNEIEIKTADNQSRGAKKITVC